MTSDSPAPDSIARDSFASHAAAPDLAAPHARCPLPRENLGFQLADVARLWRRAIAQRLEGSELTFAQARVLFYLARDPGLRQVELASRLEIQPITLARLLDPLDRRGLIERRRDPADRRAWRIHMTAAAEEALVEIRRIGETVRRDAVLGIDAGMLDELRSMLRQIWRNLAEPDRTADTTADGSNDSGSNDSGSDPGEAGARGSSAFGSHR